MIDIKTFMLVMAIGNIAFALLMAGYARGSAESSALRLWKWAKLVQGFAHLSGWLRAGWPSPWFGALANTLLLAGLALEMAAYANFFNVKHWRPWVAFSAIGLIVSVNLSRFLGLDNNAITVEISVGVAAYTGGIAWLLLRPGSTLQRVIASSHVLFFFAMAYRAYVALSVGGLATYQPDLVQVLVYVSGYMIMIVNGFGFLLLCKEKDDRAMALLATTDSLTGLLNRRAFFEHTERARALAARLRKPVSLLMLDIDHFKRLNDQYGHATGDEALRVFAAAAQASLREIDVFARMGGEEFALVLPGTDAEGAMQAAERLRLAVLAATLRTDSGDYHMTVSIGVADVERSEPLTNALARADHALYDAKASGRNRVAFGPMLKMCA